MSDYYEMGRLIDNMLNKAQEECLTIWIVEEETGESMRLCDFLNSEKRFEEGVFKRVV